MNNQTYLQMRASPLTYLLFVGSMAIPLIISIIAQLQHPGSWSGVFVCVLILCGILLWLWTFQILVSNGQLSYVSLLGGRKIVNLNDIESARIQIGHSRYLDRFKPPVRLVLTRRNNSNDSKIEINLKVFSKPDVDNLLSLLGVR